MTKPIGKPDILDEDDVIDPPEDIVVPDDDATPAPEKKVVDLDEEDDNDQEFKKLDNKAFAKLRKENADAKRERDEMAKKIKAYEAQKVTPPREAAPVVRENRQRQMIGGIPVPETKEEWDALARKDWQSAVDLRSIISARSVRDEHIKVEAATRSLNESKDKVLQRHPELGDANSDKGQIFMKILEKNPEYLTMSKGPILAMRDMEEEMETLGYTKEQIYDTKKAVAATEATRVSRGSLTVGGRMTEKAAGRTVQLSKDDMEFCKSQGIDPVAYAKERLALETRKNGAQL